MKKTVLYLGAGVVAGVLLMAAAWWILNRPGPFQGSLIEPALPAAEIVNLDQHGDPFRLSEQRGKVVLLAFGYTHCPDVCPATLAQFKQIKEGLGDQAGRAQFVLVTVDPERDTPEQMKAYLEKFDPQFIGLTGARADLESIWKNYFVFQETHDTGHTDDYSVDHTARIYAIDKGGNLRLTYPLELGSDAILSDVRRLIQE